jgi:hypothetical protein
VAGAVNIGVVGWQLLDFGRLMHRIVEAVAKHAGLVPLEPSRRPLPLNHHPGEGGNPAAMSHGRATIH